MKRLYLILLLVGLPLMCLCQPGNPGNPDVPITGIELLIAGGLILGIRRLLSKKKN